MNNLTQRRLLAPHSFIDWMRSRRELRSLRSLLERLLAATPLPKRLHDGMAKLIQKIAEEEDCERQSLATIAAIEKMHQKARHARQLRVRGPLMAPTPAPRKPESGLLAALFLFSFRRPPANRI